MTELTNWCVKIDTDENIHLNGSVYSTDSNLPVEDWGNVTAIIESAIWLNGCWALLADDGEIFLVRDADVADDINGTIQVLCSVSIVREKDAALPWVQQRMIDLYNKIKSASSSLADSNMMLVMDGSRFILALQKVGHSIRYVKSQYIAGVTDDKLIFKSSYGTLSMIQKYNNVLITRWDSAITGVCVYNIGTEILLRFSNLGTLCEPNATSFVQKCPKEENPENVCNTGVLSKVNSFSKPEKICLIEPGTMIMYGLDSKYLDKILKLFPNAERVSEVGAEAELSKHPDMVKKLVGLDNYDRETVSDFLVCEKILMNSSVLRAVCNSLNENNQSTFVVEKPLDYKLYVYEP